MNAEVVAPLKYLSNFWKYLDLPLINCRIDLDLTWSKNCVISELSRTPEVGGDNPVDATLTTEATFQKSNPKLYVLFVTLSTDVNIKILENTKQGLKITIFWNKYRSEITTQPKI